MTNNIPSDNPLVISSYVTQFYQNLYSLANTGTNKDNFLGKLQHNVSKGDGSVMRS